MVDGSIKVGGGWAARKHVCIAVLVGWDCCAMWTYFSMESGMREKFFLCSSVRSRGASGDKKFRA